MSAVINNIHL